MRRRGRFLYRGVIILMIAFLLLMAALLGRELWLGRTHKRSVEIAWIEDEDREKLHSEVQDTWEKTGCVLIGDGTDQSAEALETMSLVLEQMKISYRSIKAAGVRKRKLKDCSSAVMAVTDLEKMGEGIAVLLDWVKDGGELLVMYSPSNGAYMQMLEHEIGISSSNEAFVQAEALRFCTPIMPGGDGVYEIEDGHAASRPVLLADDCRIYMETDGEYPVPLLWKRPLGQGNVVMVNLGYMGKQYRGIYAAAFSLLGEGNAWPVINGSAYLLDDFPGPTPDGNTAFIERDYQGSDIQHFIRDVWCEDLSSLAEDYGLHYTGAVLERYAGEVDGTIDRNGDYAQYEYLGNILFRTGGELAYHGYNPTPLALTGLNGNIPWESASAMAASLKEIDEFCKWIYPEQNITVYIPPSNMLSAEGRKVLTSQLPQVKAICGVYLPGENLCEQEYGVADDGIVEIPWATQGFLFDDDTSLMAISELMFHYSGEHFLHLDELLDFDEESEFGWPELYDRMTEYVKWQQESAPGLRQLTASELAAAVERYDAVTVRRTWEKDRLVLELGNFVDEAWLLVRLNDRKAGEVSGGTLETVLDGLYLLKADSDRVEIALE